MLSIVMCLLLALRHFALVPGTAHRGAIIIARDQIVRICRSPGFLAAVLSIGTDERSFVARKCEGETLLDVCCIRCAQTEGKQHEGTVRAANLARVVGVCKSLNGLQHTGVGGVQNLEKNLICSRFVAIIRFAVLSVCR